ncbi:MAG: efflux RND transporter periplasmic adaptor subunit [Planctomycetaceae bacterium]|nr:efflux RND transporter periplasmic adaptor subunit [Planctomycetaceae bacterium]
MSKPWDGARRWVWRTLKVALIVAVIVGVVYWVRFAPVTVTQHLIEQGEIVAEVMGTGTLEARVKATVSSKISGRIEEVSVDQGDRVNKGQLLVRLDDEELRQQVAIAQANREAAQAAIDRLKTDKDRTAAVFAQAKTSHARIQALHERNVATKEELDKAVELLSVAQADISRAEAAITEGQKELIAAEKTLEYHRARLADTEINAPFDGLIVRRQRDPGDVVVPGSSILTLISTETLWISAWVDETEISKLKVEQPARVVFRSEPGRSYPGNVVRLGREADRETREFIVDVRVLELPKNWAVGQRAEVYIEKDRKSSVVLLPAKYVVRRDDRSGVFVERDGHAEWRPLAFGLRSPGMIEVIEGLKSGETVVIPSDPSNSLSEDQRIVMP